LRKLIFIFSILSFALLTFGQKDLVVIKGKITEDGIFEGNDIEDENLLNKIPGMITWLIINDSLIIESQPDSSGQFEYKISRKFLQSYKVKITAFQDQNILDKKFPTNDCPYIRQQSKYFRNDVDLHVPEPNVQEITVNLKPRRMCIDMRDPCIGFKKNSVEFINCFSDNSDTSLACIKQILKENSAYKVKINIYSWNEDNIKMLSIKRGDYILHRLAELGVDTNRIIIQIQGDKKPLISIETIKKSRTKAEKESLEQRNRRATFSAILE